MHTNRDNIKHVISIVVSVLTLRLMHYFAYDVHTTYKIFIFVTLDAIHIVNGICKKGIYP